MAKGKSVSKSSLAPAVSILYLTAELIQSRADLRMVLDNSDQSIFSVDRERRLVTFNSTLAVIMHQIWGIELEIGMDLGAQIPSHDERAFWDTAYDRGFAGERFVLDLTYENPMGYATVEFSINPIQEGDEITGVAVFGKDITDTNRLIRTLSFQSEALEQASEAVFAISPARIITSWNLGAEQIYGVPRAEMIGKNATEVFTYKVLTERSNEVIWKKLVRNKKWSGDCLLRLPDGCEVILFVSLSIVFRKTGGIRGYVAVASDVTEIRNATKLLAASEAQYRLLFESSPLPMLVMDPDTLRILQVNPATCQQYGYSAEELTMMTLWDIRPPAERERLKEVLPQLVNSADSNRGVWAHLKKDGSVIYVDINSGSIDFQGKPARIVHLMDVTVQVMAEKELRIANERFQHATEAVNAAIYEWDVTTGSILYTRGLLPLLGFDPQVDSEADNLEWLISRIHPDDLSRVQAQVLDALKHERQYEIEYRARHRDDYYIPIWDHGMIERNAAGWAVIVVGSAQDLSERKALEAQLLQERNQAIGAKEKAEEMNRLKSSFLANMSHEIRTPMTAILGFAEVLAEREKEIDLKEFAAIIQSSSTRLLNTINGILDLAQIEASRIESKATTVDVNAEAQRTCALLEPLAARRKVLLRFRPTARSAEASIDSHHLERIVTNLIGNAVKFTDEGEITMRTLLSSEPESPLPAGFSSFLQGTAPAGEHIRLIVEDTGVGIAPEFLPLIFKEFHQASSGLNRTYEGTGLGLTIVSSLVESMGGSIEVRSALGIGSAFIVRFPRNLPATEIEQIETKPSAKQEILHVEDSPEAIKLVETLLGDRYHLFHAIDVYEARKLLLLELPDLILMDINLGEFTTGLDLTREIRREPRTANIPVVALTAFASKADRSHALDAGCDDFLSKPFTSLQLFKVVERNLPAESLV